VVFRKNTASLVERDGAKVIVSPRQWQGCWLALLCLAYTTQLDITGECVTSSRWCWWGPFLACW
jgi:hypothetical protein